VDLYRRVQPGRDRPAYLAQSPQFYKQTMVGVFERVFEIGPVFRAEPHDTPRHLNQYASLDAEMGFIEDHTTVMALLERTIAGMLSCLQQEAKEELELLGCQARHAATRGFRHGPGAVGRSPGRRSQCARNHTLSARHAALDAVITYYGSKRDIRGGSVPCRPIDARS